MHLIYFCITVKNWVIEVDFRKRKFFLSLEMTNSSLLILDYTCHVYLSVSKEVKVEICEPRPC